LIKIKTTAIAAAIDWTPMSHAESYVELT